MADNAEPGQPVALSFDEIWRSETLAPLFRPRIVLRVVAVVTVALAALAVIELIILARGDHADLSVGAVSNLVTWVGAIYAFCWGVYTYGDKKEQSNKEPFLKEQLRLCFRASELAATLTSETCTKKWEEARQEFWRLYYGPLCIVEDPDVARAMVNLSDKIPRPEHPRPDQLPIADVELRRASINLAHAARRLILAAWDVKLAPLTERTP